MALTDYSTSAASNLLLGSIPIGPGMVREKVNDAFQQLMADIAAKKYGISNIINVMDYGATGDGVADDWEACQRAVDAAQDTTSGGIVYFPPGKTFRLRGNTIIIWGSNVHIVGYGATLYKDNAGGSAGTYGDAITVIGQLNNTLYYSPKFGGNYVTPALYSGSNVTSKNVVIEGLRVTFGTHSTTSINGISGLNFDGLTVKNCTVTGATQTAFAFAADKADCLNLRLERCLADGAGTQGYRIIAISPSPGKFSGQMVNCKEKGTTGAISPFPEQNGLTASAFVRSSGSDVQFDFVIDSCDFSSPLHSLDGYKTLTVRNSALGYVMISNASPKCVNEFSGCRYNIFSTSSGSSNLTSQVFARNSYVGPAVLSFEDCTFLTPASSQYTFANYGFDLSIETTVGGPITYYHVAQTAYVPRLNLTGVDIDDPGSAAPTSSGVSNVFNQCIIKAPLGFIGTDKKTISVRDSHFVVDAGFSTYCITASSVASISTINNRIEYTNNAYSTILVNNPVYSTEQTNTYLYNAGADLSYDQIRLAAIPTAGYWQVGSRVINSAPTVGQPKAWVCTVAGAPGTWVSEGNL